MEAPAPAPAPVLGHAGPAALDFEAAPAVAADHSWSIDSDTGQLINSLPLIVFIPDLTQVSGSFFLECFAGEAIFTIAVVMSCVPALCPWDTRYGCQFDVVSGLNVLLTAIARHTIVAMHLGTPCRSFTRARVPQLRSRQHVLGLPGLPPTLQALSIQVMNWRCVPLVCVLPFLMPRTLSA